MASVRLFNGKNIIVPVLVVIAIGIYGTQYMHKNLVVNYPEHEVVRVVPASMSSVLSCDLPENIFTNVRKIVKSNLTQVKSIFPDIKPDKCIESVIWKSVQHFSQMEIERYNTCTVKNANPKVLFVDSIRRLDRSVTHSFFAFLKRKSDVAIVEVGGYTGNLLKLLIPATGAKYYVVIEPVPSFYNMLSKSISTFHLKSSVTTYNFGIGKRYKKLVVGVRGDATAVSKNSDAQKTETIQVVSIVDFFVQLGLGCRPLDLLTINCEGCEFDILETLVSTNLIEKIDYIQFQPHHAVPNLGNYPCRYCRVRQLLTRTHAVVYEYPQVWEAWKNKKLVN
jgi:FkbM family methyltransferase